MQSEHSNWLWHLLPSRDLLDTKPLRCLLIITSIHVVTKFLLSELVPSMNSYNSKHTGKKLTRGKQPTPHRNHAFMSSHVLDYNSCVDDKIVPKKWCLDSESIPRYVGREEWPPRTIQHYSHAGYEKCLANKTVVFIGDSRVRYQFMHLASFLQTQKRMKCEDYGTISSDVIVPSPECFLIEHERWGMHNGSDWTSWYKRSTDMINSDPSNVTSSQQSALCDCYRDVPFRPETTYENRFLTSHINSARRHQVNLSPKLQK